MKHVCTYNVALSMLCDICVTRNSYNLKSQSVGNSLPYRNHKTRHQIIY